MRELPMPEECLGYGLVVPFPAYGFASLVSHNESLNSLKIISTRRGALLNEAFYLYLQRFTRTLAL